MFFINIPALFACYLTYIHFLLEMAEYARIQGFFICFLSSVLNYNKDAHAHAQENRKCRVPAGFAKAYKIRVFEMGGVSCHGWTITRNKRPEALTDTGTHSKNNIYNSHGCRYVEQYIIYSVICCCF